MRRLALFFLLTFSFISSNAQGIAVGEWREHLPYSEIIDIATYSEYIYAATPYSLFYYNSQDGLVTRLSKVNGLNDIGISAIEFVPKYKLLIICYKNTNIDFLYTNGQIKNLPDIKRKTIVGNKKINNISIDGNTAYLSCGFGIVTINMDKLEIKNTYYIGENGSSINVNDLAISDSTLFAATEKGIFTANKFDPEISYFKNWHKIANLSSPNANYSCIKIFNDSIFTILKNPNFNDDTIFYSDNNNWKLFNEIDTAASEFISLNISNKQLIVCGAYHVECFDKNLTSLGKIYTYGNSSPQPNFATYSENGKDLWIADASSGLMRTWGYWNNESIAPNGPIYGKTFAINAVGSTISAVGGGYDHSFQNVYSNILFYVFANEKWTSYAPTNINGITNFRDAVCIQTDPNDDQHIFVGTFGDGLLEIQNSELVKVYNDSTSQLSSITDNNRVKVCGLKYDDNGNLWIATSNNSNFINVIKPNGNMKTFSFPASYTFDFVGKITFDKNGLMWVCLSRGDGIFVMDYNGTIDKTSDDKYKKLTSSAGYGGLHNLYVNDIAIDKDNEVWIASNDGISVIYNPSNIFSNGNFDAQRILVETDGVVEPLFDLIKINCITVDAANRKWIGTETSGAYLISDNGQKEIYHFTEENSPLFSNNITDITIQPKTGEVFFATTEGIISFRSTATEGSENMDSLIVFPNPVKKDYNGYVSISGLVDESWVTITDIYGNLVYKGLSLGGQFVWNCLDVYGNRPATGVYIVFTSNADGTIKKSGKFMFFN